MIIEPELVCMVCILFTGLNPYSNGMMIELDHKTAVANIMS